MKQFNKKENDSGRAIADNNRKEITTRTIDQSFIDNRKESVSQRQIQALADQNASIQLTKKKKAEKKVQKKSKAEVSWENLCNYSVDKAKKVERENMNTYLQVMQEFVDYYDKGIRGHHSGGSGSGQNAQTTEDLKIFNSWYKRRQEGL